MQACIAIKANGIKCTTIVLGGTRCGVHVNTMNRVGPNEIRRKELKYVHEKNEKDNYRAFHTSEDPMEVRIVAFRAAKRTELIRYHTELHALENLIVQETAANGGVNADDEAIARRQLAFNRRAELMREAWQRRVEMARHARADNARHQEENVHIVDIPAENRNLGQIANDRQNVHTAAVVQKVKDTVEKVLKVVVPPEYATETLKTPGEIILECKLSKNAAWQMMAKYCAEEDIYDMGRCIYAKVLNSVWQYIKASPDAVDLKKILAAEMQDNIGMCAQGNLSRLCNILSGYIDGLNVDIKSKNEILGDLFSRLMNIEDVDERLDQAARTLTEHQVPADEWPIWIEPLE